MRVVVVLPTYNERENIVTLLDRLIAATSRIDGYSFSYLVVDDSSPDGTADVVEQLSKKNKSIHLLTGKKEGLGKALLRGISYGIEKFGADIVLQMDADLSHDPGSVPKFFELYAKGADFIVGSRYIRGGSIPDNWGLHRKIYSILGNSIVRFGLGYPSVHDWTGGYRLYHKKYFEESKQALKSYNGYVFQIAFLHRAILLGAKIGEVPIHFTDRRYGHSKIAPSEYIRDILRYIFKARIHSVRHGPFGKFLVVGTVGFIINTLVLELGVYSGFHPAISTAVGAECAIISNFILNNAWTFSHRKISNDKVFGKFLQFNTTSLGALLIQTGTVAAGTFIFGTGLYRLFYIFGVGLGLIWNYWMYSHVIWKTTDGKK